MLVTLRGSRIDGVAHGRLKDVMTPFVAYVIAVVATAVALYALWHSFKGFRFSNPLFYGVAATEVLLIVGGVGALFAGGNQGDPILFWSYYVTTLIIAPAAVIWGIGDKTRWGTGVVSIAMLTVAVLSIRLMQIWQGHG